MAKDKYKTFDDDWSNGPRERKDKPGKKHNNNQHNIELSPDGMNSKKKVVKTPQKFKKHSDCDDDD